MIHHNRQIRRCLGPLVGTVACVSLVGCAAPLLSPDENRTQYDGYDKLRNQHAEQYMFDDFGTRHPDLRDRLSPKD